MGFLSQVSTVVPMRPSMRAATMSDYIQAFFSGGDISPLGGNVPPEMALTLAYVCGGVSTISDVFGTVTCQVFEGLGGDGRQRVAYWASGIGALAGKRRWEPNQWQTAKAFWSTLAWQYL